MVASSTGESTWKGCPEPLMLHRPGIASPSRLAERVNGVEELIGKAIRQASGGMFSLIWICSLPRV